MSGADLTSRIAGRRLIGYGASLALLGAQATHRLPLAYVVDDTPGFAGQTIDGLPIHPTAQLADESPADVFVVVYAFRPESLRAIAARLHRLGLRAGTHFADCSLLHRDSMAPRLRALGLAVSADRFDACRRLTLYAIPRNLSAIAGAWLWTELAEHTAALPGAAIECGAYEGGSAFVSLMTSEALRRRPYRLVDTWEGLPEVSSADPASRGGEFRDVDLAGLRDRFGEFPNVTLHQGRFEDQLPALPDEPVALAYVDCDLYEGARTCCERLWPRLAAGGAFLFHDYWTPDAPLPAGAPAPFTGIRRAVDEFFTPRGVPVHVFPETTHALVLKP